MRGRVFLAYGMIALGSLAVALGLDMFLVPNKIAAGGVSGLATVAFYVFGFPVGITMLVINIPLFLGSLKRLGARFGVKTLFGFVLLSVLVDALQPFIKSPTNDPLLASLYGGVLTGVGLGMVFRAGGTTGGTDLAAQLIRSYSTLSIGVLMMLVDGFVIVLAGIAFSAELALYGLVSVFISSRVIDVVQVGVGYAARAAFIISNRNDVIAGEIMSRLDRGATFLEGKGAFTLENRGVLLTVVSRAELSRLKRVVEEIDPNAFIIVAHVHEVFGEGFEREA